MINQKRINEIMKKIQERKEKQAAFRQEKLELTQEIGRKKQEIVNAFANGIHGDQFHKLRMVIDDDVRKLEEKVKEVEIREYRWELETRNDLSSELEELKKLRQEMVQKGDERINELNEKLFKKKLEQMKELHELFVERQGILEEIEDISSVIREIDKNDRKPTVKDFDTNKSRYGLDTVSVIVTEDDQAAVQGRGKLPDFFKLFLKYGIIERDFKKASSILREKETKN
jgi:hypothetical protein